VVRITFDFSVEVHISRSMTAGKAGSSIYFKHKEDRQKIKHFFSPLDFSDKMNCLHNASVEGLLFLYKNTHVDKNGQFLAEIRDPADF
jgi:hypothetical protein